MKKVVVSVAVAVLLLAAVVLVRTALYGSSVAPVEPVPAVPVPAGAAERLAGATRIPTISHEDPTRFDGAAFQALHDYGIVSAAVARLERTPFPARLEGPTRQFFDRLGPRFPFAPRAAFANLWLTRPLVIRSLGTDPTTNAMVRTTTAATIFQAGSKDNVLPTHARAVINFRILPGDRVETVLAHVRRVVDDPRVEVRTVGRFSAEPSAVSSTGSERFRALERTIRRVAPDAIVAPYLVLVVTDSRYFGGLSGNVFRFLPVRLGPSDLARMHGTDERIGVGDYEGAIRMYRQILLEAAGS